MRFSEFRQIATRAAVTEVAKWIFRFLMVASATLLAWLVSTNAWQQLGDLRWPLGVTLGALVAFGVTLLVEKRSIYSIRYPRQTYPYEVLKKTLIYEIGDDGVLRFVRRMHIRALRDHVEDYIDRFIWTAGPTSIPVGNENVTRTERLARAGIWTFFKADFGRSLRRGNEYEFEVRWPPIENWAESSPFVSTSTEEPTHELVFELRLPAGTGKKVLAETMRGIEALYPFDCQELELDNGRCTWRINRPPLYTHFRLRWNWQGTDPKPMREAIQQGEERSDANS